MNDLAGGLAWPTVNDLAGGLAWRTVNELAGRTEDKEEEHQLYPVPRAEGGHKDFRNQESQRRTRGSWRADISGQRR